MGINTKKDLRDIARLGDAMLGTRILNREPQRSYMFDVKVFDHLGNHTLDELQYYAKSVELPTISKDQVIIDFMDMKFFSSGKDSSPHTLTITFWDDQSLTVNEYMREWFDLTGKSTDGTAIQKTGYVKDIEVRLKDVTDLFITGSFRYHNCHPIEISSVPLSYEDSAILELPVIFSYEYVSFNDARVDVSLHNKLFDRYITTPLKQAIGNKG